MKLSNRALYGTRVLLDLALRGGDGPVPLKEIAQRQAIPLTYLEHLVAPLIAAGIIKSKRGARGGISLSRPPQAIKLNEAIQVLEGSTAPADCVNDPKFCSRSELCFARDIWSEIEKAINSVLESRTLQDLAEGQKSKEQTTEAMYHI